MRANTSLKRMMELKVGVGVSLAVGLMACAAWAAEQKAPARPSTKNPTSANVEKAESKQDRLDRELATMPLGDEVQLTAEEYPELYAALLRGQVNDILPEDQAPTPGSPVESVQLVETTGGFLGIFDQGDGVVHLAATTINRESPDLENAGFGLAFSAIITVEGFEITSVDMDGLARFVGNDLGGTVGADGWVASVEAETTDGGPDPTATAAATGDCIPGTSCCFVVVSDKVCFCCGTVGPPPGIQCACTLPQ